MNKSLIALAMLSVGATYAADDDFKRPTPRDSEFQHKSQFLFSIGLQNGGEPVGLLVDQSSGEITDKARAGGYVRLEAGGLIAFPEVPVSLEITAGILNTQVVSNIGDGRSDFNRTIVSMIPFYNFGRQRVGVGASVHLDPTLKFRPTGGTPLNFVMDDDIAAIVQWDVRYDQNISVGARYTFMTYTIAEADDPSAVGLELDANSFGVHFTYAF